MLILKKMEECTKDSVVEFRNCALVATAAAKGILLNIRRIYETDAKIKC